MINHIRTLLLNQGAETKPEPDFPGEQFVPETFKPIQLPSSVMRFRNTVFGRNPDRLMLNYRLWQLLMLLHSTELSEYVTALDKRVTYWPPRRERGFSDAFIIVPPAPVHLLGNLEPSHDGQLQHRFLVTYLGGNNVKTQRLTPPMSTTTVSAGNDGSVTSPQPLPGTSLKFEFQLPLAVASRPYALTIRKRPAMELPQVLLALESTITEEDFESFFATGFDEMRTFIKLYREHKQLPYRLGGITLAVAYMTEHARVNGGV